MTGTVAVVVCSFERPHMLREALASIGPCDQAVEEWSREGWVTA